MKKAILYIIISSLSSCYEKPIPPQNHADEIFQKLSKTPDNQLTKIELPSNIVLDTIDADHKNIEFEIKNSGNKNLTSLFIKPYCSCVIMPNYKTTMASNETQKIKVNMSFNNLGNFYLPITVYGNFYPYKRIFYVEGYRRK